jgi:hypothetical protein
LLAKPVVCRVIVGAIKPHKNEEYNKGAEVKIIGEELLGLDAITAPTPLYPSWFNANLVDAKQKAALE